MYNKKQPLQKSEVTFSRSYETRNLPRATVYLRKKLKHENAGWLYIRAFYQGQRIERSIGIKVKETDWDQANECMPRNMQISREIWEEKEKFLVELSDALSYAEQQKVSSPDLKLAAQIVSGISLCPELMLELFDLEITRMKEKKGEGFTASNIQKHSVCKRHFKEYLIKYYRREDVLLKDMNKKMIEGFLDYLRSDCGNGHNSTVKLVAILKKMFKVALDNMWVQHNPFAGIKLCQKKVKRDFLDQEEIDAIQYRDFHSQRLNLVRDYFIFSCYTGLAYIDLMSLTRASLKEYLGRTWLNIERVKTQVSASIPLLAPARIILERYQPDWKTLPAASRLFKKISNQKMNSYLKEIITICHIEKNVSFHISRHTFASTVKLANNIPIETVSKLMGHTKIAMTQHYSKVVDQKIDRDIAALSDRLDEEYNRRSQQHGEAIVRKIR